MAVVIIVVIILIFVGAVAAVEYLRREATPEPDSDSYVRYAHYKRSIGDEDGQFEALSKAIELQLQDPEAQASLDPYWRRGSLAYKRREFETAIDDFSASISQNPNFSGSYFGRGMAYFRQGRLENALPDFDEAIRLEPRLAIPYDLRGHIHLRQKNWDKALTDLDQALHLINANAGDASVLKPSLSRIYANRALVRSRLGDYEGAASDYEDAILLNPSFAMAYNNRGWLHANHGAFDKAVIDCNQAINLNPKLVNAFGSRGYTYFQKGDYPRALQDFDDAIRIKPDHKFAIAGQAVCHYAMGKTDQAKALWQQVITMDERYQDAQTLADEYYCGGAFVETARKLAAELDV